MADTASIDNATEVYRRLLSYCRPYWPIFAGAALAMAVFALTEVAFAFLIGQIVEEATADDQGSVARWIPWAILGLFVFRAIAGFGSGYGLAYIARKVINEVREEVFAKFLRLPVTYFDKRQSGSLLAKLAYNVEQIAEATSSVVTVLIRDSLSVIGLVGYMVYVSPPLSIFILVIAPCLAVVIRVMAKIFRRHNTRIQESMGDVVRITGEVLQSVRIVKIFGGEEYENKRFAESNEKNRRLHMRLAISGGAGGVVQSLIMGLGVAGVVFFATLESVRLSDLGDFVSFLSAMILLLRPVRALTGVNATIQRGVAAGSSLFAVLDEPEENNPGRWQPGGRVDGRVDFRHVNFSYSNTTGPVLHDIVLSVGAGENVAIVGRSGSGKSTLVNLLARFYEPTGGEIFIDDKPVLDYELSALRSQISFVSQEVVLFNDTIANNIAYGALRGASRQEIEAAAHAAHVDEFVSTMPGGLDAMVGDRGVLLSGGQRQRLAIARALLKDSPILILDEATSALDTQSERHIQAALEELMLNRTTFVIAHRLSTIERADRILVMSAGRVVESGSHSELMKLDGQYATLHRMQFRDAQ